MGNRHLRLVVSVTLVYVDINNKTWPAHSIKEMPRCLWNMKPLTRWPISAAPDYICGGPLLECWISSLGDLSGPWNKINRLEGYSLTLPGEIHRKFARSNLVILTWYLLEISWGKQTNITRTSANVWRGRRVRVYHWSDRTSQDWLDTLPWVVCFSLSANSHKYKCKSSTK